MKRGLESSLLQVFNKEAGTPSAPAADDALNDAEKKALIRQ